MVAEFGDRRQSVLLLLLAEGAGPPTPKKDSDTRSIDMESRKHESKG